MEWFAHIDGCCWRSGIIWRQTCPQLAALQLVHEFICTAWQVQKKLVKITLTCNCAVMLLAQLIMWLAHDFWLHIILCKQQLFNFYLSVTCTAGKQAWNAVPSHLPFYSVAGMMELCFFYCHLHTFWIITLQAFIVRHWHWFKCMCIPEQIRNRTVPIIVRNGLNFLSNDEEHGLLGIPTTEWDGWNIQWKYTCTWFLALRCSQNNFW